MPYCHKTHSKPIHQSPALVDPGLALSVGCSGAGQSLHCLCVLAFLVDVDGDLLGLFGLGASLLLALAEEQVDLVEFLLLFLDTLHQLLPFPFVLAFVLDVLLYALLVVPHGLVKLLFKDVQLLQKHSVVFLQLAALKL